MFQRPICTDCKTDAVLQRQFARLYFFQNLRMSKTVVLASGYYATAKFVRYVRYAKALHVVSTNFKYAPTVIMDGHP